MRKLTTSVVTGLAGAAMVATAMQQPASAAPVAHDGATAGQAKAAAHRPDNRLGPATKKQLALRQAAFEKVAAGKATPNSDGVVKLGSDKFAEVTAPKQDEIFTILAEFGTQSAGKYGTAPGPAAQRDPGAGPHQGQLHDVDRGLQQGLLREPLQRLRRVDEVVLRGPVERAVLRHQRGAGLGAGALQRVLLRRQRHRGLRRLLGVHRGRRRRVVRQGRGRDGQRRGSRRVPVAVRRLGPQRLRQRRQLRRGRRLHRPLPGRARRSGRGRRRRRAGRGRHLVAPLVRQRRRLRRRPARPSASERRTRPAAPGSASRSTGSATTRPSRRTAASACSPTSSATTSACRTTTTPPAARTAPRSGP